MLTTSTDKLNMLHGKWQSVIVTFDSNKGKEQKVGHGHKSREQKS